MENEIQTSVQSNSKTKKKIISLYKDEKISFLIGLILIFSLILFSMEEDNPTNTIKSSSEINLVIQGTGYLQVLNSYYPENIEKVIVNGNSKGNTCIRECLFENDLNNVTIIFEGSVETCRNMFYNSKNIAEIDLSNFDSSNITDISGMFYGCSKLKSIKLNNLNTSLVTTMSYIFCGCESLNSIDISKLDTSNVIYMISMFKDCISLISIDLSNFETPSLKYMSSMFQGCTSLKYLNISNFNTKNVETMENLFYKCNSLTSISILL